MSDTPTPRSYPQILGAMLDAFLSNQGIRNLRTGNPILSAFECASQSDLRSSQDIFDLLNSADLDKAVGLALDRKGADAKVPRLTESPSTGAANIGDSSFVRISTKLFQGRPAPIVGSTSLDVVDASLIPDPSLNTVKIYIGRGTAGYEGPLTVASRVDNGSYWTLGLTSPTVKFHNVGDEIVLAQGGNRIVAAGSIVRTPQANLSSSIDFKLLYGATLPDGETDLANVSVICTKPGVVGRVPANAINSFAAPPFTGATVTNPLPFTTGTETEDDDTYRERIKKVLKSKAQGIPLAIKTAVTGIVAPDENKRVSSASFVVRAGYPSTLYIDDGTGYEERSAGVAIESLSDSATGGEQFFEVIHRPITKASCTTQNAAPYNLASGMMLSVRVGGVSYTHSFTSDDFDSVSNASAFEVVASLNANDDLGFTARVVQAGTKVLLTAKADTNEDLQVLAPDEGEDANEVFRFATTPSYSIQLYKNDRLLSKDGRPAVLRSGHFNTWDTLAGDQTLVIAVDGTPAQTYTFSDVDFVNGRTGFVTLGKNSVDAWCAVINAKIPGLTATAEGQRIVLTSNVATLTKSALAIVSGTLVSARVFASDVATGRAGDYDVDRNYGQIKLRNTLSAGDRLSVGSLNTRSFVESTDIPTTTIPAAIKAWFAVDGAAKIISHGVGPSTILALEPVAIHDFGHQLSITAPVDTAFSNVQPGDWCIVWDGDAPASLLGAHRVADVVSQGGTSAVILERREMLSARAGHRSVAMVPSGSGISLVLSTGGYSLTTFTPSPSSALGTTDSAEIFDPNTNTFTLAASMGWRRSYHTATALDDGRVFVAGGMYDTASSNVFLSSTEVYDPGTDSWTAGPALRSPSAHHTATKLADGRVVIIGGVSGATYSGNIDVFDPGTGLITHLSPGVTLTHARARHAAVLLPDGTVMVAGGEDSGGTPLASVEIYNPSGDTVSPGVDMDVGRRDFGISTVGSTDVIVAGSDAQDTIGVADTYSVFSGGSWSGSVPIDGFFKFNNSDLIRLDNGDIFAATWLDTATPSSHRFSSGVWTESGGSPFETDLNYYEHRQFVLLSKGDASYLNHVVGLGGRDNWSNQCAASIDLYNGNLTGDAAWTVADEAITDSIQFGSKGISFVRTSRLLQEISIGSGTNYTASSLAAIVNSQLVGAAASVYRTNRFRVRTNSFSLDGDVALVAQDTGAATALKMVPQGAVENLTGHVGSVETAHSEYGTPDFSDVMVLGQGSTLASGVADSLLINEISMSGGFGVVGLRPSWVGLALDAMTKRYGDNYNYVGHVHSYLQYANASQVALREAPIAPWTPTDRVYLASPFSVGPNDDLTVLVDNNVNKQFPIKMWRTLKPGTSTYGVSNVFLDADASNASLAAAFGLNYSFNDFAAYMRARAIAYSSDSTLKMLLRYFRFGGDGEGVKVSFVAPTQADEALSVAIDPNGFSGNNTSVAISLPSGAEKTLPIHANTRIGSANLAGSANSARHGTIAFLFGFSIASASRTSNVTTLTLTLPAGISNHGLVIGNRVFINSVDSNFSSGRFTLTAVGSPSGVGGTQTVSYAETAANHGATANIGTLSNDDAGEVLVNGSGLNVADYFHLALPLGNEHAGGSFVITEIAPQYVKCKSGTDLISSDTGGVLWTPISDPSWVSVFTNPKQTATQIAASINTAAAADNSTCPVTATILGTGNGQLLEPTADTLLDPAAAFTLVDGLNWVSITTSPVVISADYTLTFKKAVDPSLVTGSDWVNEQVRIVPITTAGIVRWLNTPAITGLFTAAVVEASSDGSKVQLSSRMAGSAGGIQVQGGLANALTAAVVGNSSLSVDSGVSTIKKVDATGLSAGMWCQLQNQIPLPKPFIITDGTSLVSWDADGLVELDSDVYSESVTPTNARLTWERQGRFVCIRDAGTLNPASEFVSVGGVDFSLCSDGHYLKIATTTPGDFSPVPIQNQGIFRVVKTSTLPIVPGSGGSIWIENPLAVEGVFECSVAAYYPESIVPGDVLVVNTDAWGEKNKGSWTVEKTGVATGGSNDQFVSSKKFKVSTESRSPQPVAGVDPLGSEADKIQVIEEKPQLTFKKLVGVCINPDDPTFVDLSWNSTVLLDRVTPAAGSVISPIDKLAFPTNFVAGVDGYSYGIGLIGEANKVVYSDPNDTATYPGVAAAGAQINIQGPIVRRVQISLNLRVSGGSLSDIADRVRSAVATVVNQMGTGDPPAISSIVSAASKVPGVVAVSVLSPLYSVNKDIIPVQPFEKPLILNLKQDISISFSGE